MNPCPSTDTLQGYLDSVLPAEESGTIEEHLSECLNCRSALERLSGASHVRRWATAGGRARTPPPDDPALTRLMDRLHVLGPASRSDAEGEASASDEARRFLAPPQDDGDLGMLGPYRVLRQLGRGGMGIVFLGRDPQLDRSVALKVMRLDPADVEVRERFLREARAAASLEHEHIVTVYEADTTPEGYPYLVMQYVAGATLQERIRTTGPLAPRVAARVCRQVAEGLAEAHAAGLVHRDIKPANILLDRVTERAKIADFGLVRVAALPSKTTHHGGLLGTPEYMSPEQVNDPTHSDGRSDVYSLGVTLYEAVTGDTPFRGVPQMVLQQVLNEEPHSPRRLNDAIPRDLETICLKAMAKEPEQRYPTARELADELGRWLNGEPIRARPVRWVGRLWRWCRRQPALAAVSSLVVLTVLGIVALLIGWAINRDQFAQWLREEKDQTEIAHKELQTIHRKHLQEFARSARALGIPLCQQQDGRGLLWLARALEWAPQDDSDLQLSIRTHWAGWRQHLPALRGFLLHEGIVLTLASSPDGKTFLTGCKNGTCQLWDTETGKPLSQALMHEGMIVRAVYSADGKTALTASMKEVRLCDATTGKSLGPPLPRQGGPVALSPDGKTVVTGHPNAVRLWDATTGKPAGPPLQHRAPVVLAVWSPDGKKVLTAGQKEAWVWDPVTGSAVCKRLEHAGITHAAISPDGNLILTASGNEAYLWWEWDRPEAEPRKRLLKHTSKITAVAISPDSKTLLTVCGREVKRWDARTGNFPPGPGSTLASTRQHQDAILAVAFSPDSKTFLTGSMDGTAQFWSTRTGKPLEPPLRHRHAVTAVAFNPDGRSVLTASADRTTWLWDVSDLLRPLQASQVRDNVLALSPDGRIALTGGSRGARLWETATGKPSGDLLPHQDIVLAAAFSADSETVLTAGTSVKVWDVRTAKPAGPPLRHPGDGLTAIALSPDGKLVLTGDRDGTAQLWNAATGEPLDPLPRHLEAVLAVAFSPDGKTVLTASAKEARLWQMATERTWRFPLMHTDKIKVVALSPGGQTVLTASANQVRLWEALTGKAVGLPLLHRDGPVGFSPDGQTVLTGSYEEIWLGEVATGKRRGSSVPQQDRVGTSLPPGASIPFHNEGHLAEGRFQIWIGGPLQNAMSLLTVNGIHLPYRRGDAVFSPDSKTVLVVSAGKAQRWEVATGKPFGPTLALGEVLTPVQGAPERIVLWTQVITGMELDSNGEVRFLDAQTWQHRRDLLEKLGGPPMH